MKALITGITGQDGSYLSEFLLSKGYEVHGIIRRASTFNTQRIDHIYVDPHIPAVRLFLHYGDLSNSEQISNIIYNIKPEEIYHLGAQSHVRVSFDMPEYTGDIDALGTTRILEAIKRSGNDIRFYQASSSEMFGASPPPQNENISFLPRSPYAASKVYAYWMTVIYREGYGLFACNGILFNHESPRRGETFVTRKITRAVANILSRREKKLYLGNLNAKRDWGFAPEYVECMWLMLQQDKPDDYVIGIGESHSVKEFVEGAFKYVGVEIEWKGEGVNERGTIKSLSSTFASTLSPGEVIIEVDPRYFRPAEVEELQSDPSKAKKRLGWSPRVDFEDLIKIMVDYDMLRVGLAPPKDGIKTLKEKGIGWIKHEQSLIK